jgi:hypothetical protein
MKSLLIFLLLSLLFLSCEKSKTNAKQTCFKGRYVGTGCWPVIQLLEPLDGSLPTALYGFHDTLYEHTFGTGEIPEQYKDGRPFYFTVTDIDSNIIYQTYCTPTKYVVVIGSFSDSACPTTN